MVFYPEFSNVGLIDFVDHCFCPIFDEVSGVPILHHFRYVASAQVLSGSTDLSSVEFVLPACDVLSSEFVFIFLTLFVLFWLLLYW